MPVSGLVVSLSQESEARAAAIEALGRETQLTLGELEANRLAVVLDTPSSQEDRRVWDWLNTLPGVSLVEVAFVGFETPEDLRSDQVIDPSDAENTDPPHDWKDKSQNGP